MAIQIKARYVEPISGEGVGMPAKRTKLSAEEARERFPALEADARPAGRPRSGKIVVSLRLEPEIVEKFRATGPGWQARINEALKAVKL